MRSIYLSVVLGAVALGLVGLTPGNAEAGRLRRRVATYPVAYKSYTYTTTPYTVYPSTTVTVWPYYNTTYVAPVTTYYYTYPTTTYRVYSYKAYRLYR